MAVNKNQNVEYLEQSFNVVAKTIIINYRNVSKVSRCKNSEKDVQNV